MKKHKLPPIKQTRVRKGNHPSNPYAGEAATAPRLEERPGYPFAMRRETALSNEAQLGRTPSSPPAYPAEKGEPIFVLRASDRLGAMLVQCWAGLSDCFDLRSPAEIQAAREIAARMDAWRQRHSAGG